MSLPLLGKVQRADLEQEPSAKVPSDRQSLRFTPLDILFTVHNDIVKRGDNAFFEPVHDVWPCCRVGGAFWREVELHASTTRQSAGVSEIEALNKNGTHLSFLFRLKSALSFPKTPLSLPKTFLPVPVALEGLTRIMRGT